MLHNLVSMVKNDLISLQKYQYGNGQQFRMEMKQTTFNTVQTHPTIKNCHLKWMNTK